MSEYFKIHPENPQGRLIHKSVEMIRDGAVIVYPTDTGYALGCHIGDKNAVEKIWQIRQLDHKHHFTLMCIDLSEVGNYAAFDTPVFRLIKATTPGPYTFILKARKEVPRRLMHPKKKTVGMRIPDHKVSQAILTELGEPLLTTTLVLPGENDPLSDPAEIFDRLNHQVDLVIDSGFGGNIPTTLIDLTEDIPVILREGKGDMEPFQ